MLFFKGILRINRRINFTNFIVQKFLQTSLFSITMELKTFQNAHGCTVDEVLSQLDSNQDAGLTSKEAEKRLLLSGENILEKQKKKSLLLVLTEQFIDPIIYILSAAMVLAFLFQEWMEGFAVLFVILMTTLIGFFMELQAIRSVEALQKLAPAMCMVLRNSVRQVIESRFLVPGDIIYFELGDVIPADARIIDSNGLALKEASLTGESIQVEKFTEQIAENTPLADQKNMVFSSTIVSRGTGKAVVTATGRFTQIGQISDLTHGAEKMRTPLEKKLNRLSRKLIWLTLILAAITAVSGYIQGKDWVLMIKTGIALAVAAIPEGLPIVATIALARGMLRLSKQNVIIKKLESVETLGEIGVICTDKTGTLTENKMAVQRVIVQNDIVKELDTSQSFPTSNELIQKLFQVCVLCNNAGLNEHQTGDPIETALIEFVRFHEGDPEKLREAFPRLEEIPFDTEKKKMTTLNKCKNLVLVCVKGAMETLIEHCNSIHTTNGIIALTGKKQWLDKTEEMASIGLRTLALAYKSIEDISQEYSEDLILLGVVGFEDPPRKDVSQAVKAYHYAGVKVVMVTGDHPQTARKIGEDIGLFANQTGTEIVIYGPEVGDFDKMSGPEREKVLNATIFARMVPEQKLNLIKLYQNNNLVVGMLGDGVNDAPALKKADVGIAMGIRGTEAAKEVADVILMDDKFTSTELAIRQGRNIFENIRHFVVFLLSCNLAEIVAVAIASISNLPLPLMPLQILFLNLVTDVFPALALGMGKGNENVMKQPPRPSDEPIITNEHWRSLAIYSFSITIAVIGITWYAHSFKNYDSTLVNNMAFYTLILGQLFNVFNLPSRKTSFIYNEVTRNKWVWGAIILSVLIVVVAYQIPFLNLMLSLVPLSLEQLTMTFVFGTIPVVLTQIIKRSGGTV